MTEQAVVIDLDAIEAAAKAAAEDKPGVNGPRSIAFLVKTNDELDGWMRSFYSDEADTDAYRLHCLWAWQEQEKRHAPIILELINRVRAAEAIASGRIEEVSMDTVAVVLVGEFKVDHVSALRAFHDELRAKRNSKTLTMFVQSPSDILVLNEEAMRKTGWVKAPGGDV